MCPEKAFGMFAVYSCTVCYSYLFYQIYFCPKILWCLISFDTIQSIETSLHESPILFSKFNVLLLTLESLFFFFHKNQVAAQFIFNLNNNCYSVQPKFMVKTYHLVHHSVRTMNEATLLGDLQNRFSFSFTLRNFLQVKVHFH